MSVLAPPDLPAGWAVHVFDETDAFTRDDVVALWLREGVLDEAEAQRRSGEVFLVASNEGGELIGVVTTYLLDHDQLQTVVWRSRVFVESNHRRSKLAIVLGAVTRELLEERFVTGADARGAGFCYSVENEVLLRGTPSAVTRHGRSAYIGQSPMDAPTFIRWFPGATVGPRR